MEDFEKLGAFYLGRPFDPITRQPKDGLLLYDSKDLVTHAVCVGMTGSGKTGLCIGMLEEAAIDGIPAIIIDPKGDLSNLLLTFPNLSAEDFEPWINPEDAQRKGVPPQEFAKQQADLWRSGLAKWGQQPERIQKLKDSADFCVFTPGSNAGVPVSIVKSFAAPPDAIRDDRELFRERISATATAILALLGIDADPIQSREHILLSNILGAAWNDGKDLDLTALIQQIQTPPMKRVGVLDLDAFYPAKDRFQLAMSLNNLLASPGFETWLEGEALDVGALLHTPAGKPRISIFSIAHLSDAERMFFVSLLLNQVVSWMRTQSGTTSLRALLYMDEIFGYFPPVANPPSKLPLLTLLKQARAFGVGVVLATQNPVDLDYKGLANCGTWFIGRLQTERDKARVLDGLEGAASGAGASFDRGQIDEILSGLGNRVFLMNNVHEDAPEVFETRWTLSYLRGPMTRTQIKTLMEPRKAQVTAAPVKAAASADSARPVLPPEINQLFLPARAGHGTLVYHPALFGAAQVRFVDAKAGVDVTRDAAFVTPIEDATVPVDWATAEEAGVEASDLENEPAEVAAFAPMPGAAAKVKSYAAWNKDFVNWLFANQTVELYRCTELKIHSEPGESERDFRVRLQQSAREERDEAKAELQQKYAPKVAAIEERIRKAQQAVAREQEQSQAARMQTALSIGSGLLGALFGRKTLSATNIGRATTAARTATRAYKESQDVNRAGENVGALQQQLQDLQEQFQQDVEAAGARMDATTLQLDTAVVRPKKTNISVRLFTLAWAPYWQDASGHATPAWK